MLSRRNELTMIETRYSSALVRKRWLAIFPVALLLLAQAAAYGAVITEDFSTDAGGWLGSADLAVVHDSGGFLVGSYGASTFPAELTGGFRAESGDSAQFTGNWNSIGFESIRFDFRSIDVIPSAFGVRFSYGTGAGIFTYFLTPKSVGSSDSYAVPVTSGAGWQGAPGAVFESAISNVDWVEVFAFQQTTGDPFSGVPPQSFHLESFEFSSEAIPVIPEPTHGMLFILGVLMLMLLRQHRHGMQPLLVAFVGASRPAESPRTNTDTYRKSWRKHRVRHRRKMPLFVLPLRPY